MVCKRFSNNCCVYRSVSKGFQSDHRTVVMNCEFPSRRLRKQVFSKKNVKTFHWNIKSLKNDKDVFKSYSDSLDQVLEDFSNFSDVNELSERLLFQFSLLLKHIFPLKNVPRIINPGLMKFFSVL